MAVGKILIKGLTSSLGKKIMMYGAIAMPIAAAPVVSTVNTVLQVNPEEEPLYYLLDQNLFDSKDAAVDYIRNSEDTERELIGSTNNYYLNGDESGSYTNLYQNSYEYRSDLLEHVVPINAKTSMIVEDISNNLDPIDRAIPLKYFNKIALEDDQNETIDIYRGFQGQIFQDPSEAKNSYYRIYDGYQYNDIFFRSREELKYYLRTVYFDNPSNLQALETKYVLNTYNEYGNKLTSVPIALENKDSSQENVEKFAKNNLHSSITYNYHDNKGNTRPIIINSKADIKKIINDPEVIDSLKNDLEFFKVYNTNGKAGFLVDTLNTDKAQLLGPNYVETTQDVNGIANKDNWNRSSNEESARYTSTINSTISSLMNYLAFEAPMNSFEDDALKLNKAYWFNYSELSGDEFSINAKFKQEMLGLGKSASDLYYDILSIAIKLEKLKNYNPFLKIPTLYTSALNLIFDRELDFEITQTVRNYFRSVAYFLDEKIYNFVPGNLLRNLNGTEYFSFVNFFGINNNSVNFNQNIANAYLDKIKTDFPYLTIYALVKDAAILNQQMYLGEYEIDETYINELTTTYISQFFSANSDIEKITNFVHSSPAKNAYEFTWNLYSASFSDQLFDLLSSTKTTDLFKSENAQAIKELFKIHYRERSMTDFIHYENSADWFIQSPTLLYYEDVNLRSKILDFYKRMRLYSTNPTAAAKYLPRSVLNNADEITNEINMVMDNFKTSVANTMTRNTQAVLTSQETKALGMIYKKSLKLSTKLNTSFGSQTKSVYNDRSQSFFRNEALQIDTSSKWEQQEEWIISSAMEPQGSLSWKVDNETAKKLDKGADVLGKSINVISKYIGGGYNSDSSKPIGVVFNELLRDVLDTGILDLFGPYGKIANTVLSILIPQVEDLTYTFKMDAENTWHRKGGTKHSMLFGLVSWEVGGISDLKIDQPISLYKNINEDRYYYNGKKYAEHAFEKLISDQLNDILEGKIHNDNFATKFFHYPKKDKNDEYLDLETFTTPEDAINAYVTKVYANIHPTNDYIESKVLDYDGDLISNVSEAIEVAIDRIAKETSLQPTKFIQLPNIKNGYVDFSENHEILKFNYPTAWNAVTNEIIKNDVQNLLINNPTYDYSDQIPKFLKYEYSSDQMQDFFLNSFDVVSKQTLTSEIIYTNNFDRIANNVSNLILYKTNIPSMQAKFFANIDDAMNYMMRLYELRIVTKDYYKYTYKYEEQAFTSIAEIETFVNQNAIAMTKKEVEDYFNQFVGA